MYYDEDDKKTYHVAAIWDANKGRTVHAILGPGLPYEPLLAGAFTAFDNELQAKTLARYLNQAYTRGANHICKALQELLTPTAP